MSPGDVRDVVALATAVAGSADKLLRCVCVCVCVCVCAYVCVCVRLSLSLSLSLSVRSVCLHLTWSLFVSVVTGNPTPDRRYVTLLLIRTLNIEAALADTPNYAELVAPVCSLLPTLPRAPETRMALPGCACLQC
jgi:hypothetical protein